MDRDFLTRVTRYRADGWRLSVINATAILPEEGLPDGAFDITWSFALGTKFETLRERVLPGEEVESISSLFDGAFLYENEMRELFGINMTGIAVDLRGELYRTATRVPFSPSAIRARLEATGRGAAPTHKAAGAASAVAAPRPTATSETGAAAGAAAAASPTVPLGNKPDKPGTAAGPEAVSDGVSPARRAEGKADASTRTSALETCVSEREEPPTRPSAAPQATLESEADR